ncbi:MAG: hypothetical protein ACREFQ_15570 [Stellaceae bacterium]
MFEAHLARPAIEKRNKEERRLVSLCAALIGDIASLGRDWAAPKWSALVRRGEPVPTGFIELGEMFRVHR